MDIFGLDNFKKMKTDSIPKMSGVVENDIFEAVESFRDFALKYSQIKGKV